MPKKKKPPAAILGTPLTPSPEPSSPSDRLDVPGTIAVLERVLTNALDPHEGVTPEVLQDLCSMFLAAMHLRKVTPEYWMEKQELPFKLVELAAQVEAESALKHLEGLPADVVKILDGSIELSLKEISGLRTKMLAEVALLRQCPAPWVSIH